MNAIQILEHNGYSREFEDMSEPMGKRLGNYFESGSHPLLSLELYILQFVHWEPAVVPILGHLSNFVYLAKKVPICRRY